MKKSNLRIKRRWILFIFVSLFFTLALTAYLIFFSSLEKDKNTDKKSIQKKDGYIIIDRDVNENTPLPFKDISSFSATGDKLYLSVDDHSPSQLANKVVELNRKTHKFHTIFTTKFDSPSVQGLQANKDWVVWVDSDDYGMEVNIYAMNIKTKKIESVTSENQEGIRNGFPILTGQHVAWISFDQKKGIPYVLIKNLYSKKTQRIFQLKTLSMENEDLSTYQNKILFTDYHNGTSTAYIYNIESAELKTIPIDKAYTGWGQLLNDHQFVYLKYFTDSEDAITNNQLYLYDFKKNKQQKFSTKKHLNVEDLYTDEKNNVFIFSAGEERFKKFHVKENDIHHLGTTHKSDYSYMHYSNGIYLFKYEGTFKKSRKELMITSKLPL
ncbi:hypothetical protein ACFCVS_02150 [Bacillus altitudinis]|uniref:hypothetical protein n=1 Tax=Bacillus altitudinis TaxID=293387 RepID=UPI0035D82634